MNARTTTLALLTGLGVALGLAAGRPAQAAPKVAVAWVEGSGTGTELDVFAGAVFQFRFSAVVFADGTAHGSWDLSGVGGPYQIPGYTSFHGHGQINSGSVNPNGSVTIAGIGTERDYAPGTGAPLSFPGWWDLNGNGQVDAGEIFGAPPFAVTVSAGEGPGTVLVIDYCENPSPFLIRIDSGRVVVR